MNFRNWFPSCLTNNAITRCRSAASKRTPRCHLAVEVLEDRTVPSALSIADVTVREGPISTGILDPAGAASVGINGIKDITFDNGPNDPHYGDLFVAGLSAIRWPDSIGRRRATSRSWRLTAADWRSLTASPSVPMATSTSAIRLRTSIFRYDGSTGAPCLLPARRARYSLVQLPVD